MHVDQSSRINAVQYLRAVAALAVVAFHTIGILHYLDGTVIHPSVGALANGVDLFFVISGFIMLRNFDHRPVGAGSFMVNRLIRIVPLYYVATTVQFCVSQVVPHLRFSATPENLAASLAFYPWEESPVLLQGWTLDLEMAFYLVFAIAIRVAPARVLAFCVAIIATMWLAGAALQPTSVVGRCYTNPIIMEFALGMLVARCWPSKAWSPALAGTIVAAGLVAIPVLQPVGDVGRLLPNRILVGCAAAAILVGALSLEKIRPGLFRHGAGLLLGNASYAIYLTHGFVILATSAAAKHSAWLKNTTAGHMAYVIATIGLSVVAGCIVHLRLEDPLVIALRRYSPLASRRVPVVSVP